MPLLCGLSMGVVRGIRPMSRAKRRVSRAVKQLPLSVSHSIGCGSLFTWPKRCSTLATMRSRTSSALIPAVVAT